MSRLGLRDRLTLVVTIGAALVLGALTFGFNLVLRSSLDHDANRVLDARAAATLATVEVGRGTVRRAEAPDSEAVDALVWIYAASRAVERPRTVATLQARADTMAGGPRRFVEDPRSDVRLLSQPIVRGNARVGTVVVGVSLEPYERSASQALIASVLFAVAIFVLVVVATRFVIGGALRPVARMTTEAAEWSDHDLDHRFHAGEPHDELTRLAATFDSMLDALAASLRHERRFSAEVSHELRTPLAAIVAEADFALRQPRETREYQDALETIARRAAQLQRTLETLLAAERAELGPLGTADAGTVARRARDSSAAIATERGIELAVVTEDRSLRLGADADAAERVLAPLIENACRYAQSRAEVRVRAREEHVDYLVSDDGPGVDADEAEVIFEPGARGRSGVAADHDRDGGLPGAGLGLSLSRRLARALDGEVRYAVEQRAFIFEAPRG